MNLISDDVAGGVGWRRRFHFARRRLVLRFAFCGYLFVCLFVCLFWSDRPLERFRLIWNSLTLIDLSRLEVNQLSLTLIDLSRLEVN